MKTALRALLVALVALLPTSAAIAHHSFAMFDRTVEKVITGTVVRWQFNSPHSWLYLNVKSPDGGETLWSFEGSAPPARFALVAARALTRLSSVALGSGRSGTRTPIRSYVVPVSQL